MLLWRGYGDTSYSVDIHRMPNTALPIVLLSLAKNLPQGKYFDDHLQMRERMNSSPALTKLIRGRRGLMSLERMTLAHSAMQLPNQNESCKLTYSDCLLYAPFMRIVPFNSHKSPSILSRSLALFLLILWEQKEGLLLRNKNE